MLRDSTVEVCKLLTQKFSDANVCVDSLPQSPVNEAVMATYTPVIEHVVSSGNGYSLDWCANVLTTMSKTQEKDGTYKHDDVIANIVDVASKTVQLNLHVARNVVNPIIKSVVAAIEADLQRADIKLSTQLAILPVGYRNIWNSPVLESMVERYSDSAVNDIRMNFVHKHLTPEEIGELVKSGSGRFNDEIDEWVKSFAPDFLTEVYHKVFCSDSPFAAEQNEVTISGFINNDADIDHALAIHLMARKLKTNVQEDINLSLSDYREYMANILEQSGRAVCRIMEKRVRDKKQRNLVSSWPSILPESLSYQKVEYIRVNEDIYNAWLEEGGTPEVLMGSFLYDKETGYSQLIDQKEHLTAVWERRKQLLRTQAYSARFNTTAEALGRAVAMQINSLKEEELPTARAELHRRLGDFMNDLNVTSVEDIYLCTRRAVCYTMFAHTNAEKILDSIDLISKENPGIDVREAALLAVCDIVVDWVVAQFKVTKTASV